MKCFLWCRTAFVSKFGFLTENARLGSFLGRFGRKKVAYPAQGTIYNKKPIDTMPLSVLVYELEGPPNFGNR